MPQDGSRVVINSQLAHAVGSSGGHALTGCADKTRSMMLSETLLLLLALPAAWAHGEVNEAQNAVEGELSHGHGHKLHTFGGPNEERPVHLDRHHEVASPVEGDEDATPTEELHQGTKRGPNDFTLQLIPNDGFVGPLNGLAAMAKAFAKYNRPLPPALQTAAALNPVALLGGFFDPNLLNQLLSSVVPTALPTSLPTSLASVPTSLPTSFPTSLPSSLPVSLPPLPPVVPPLGGGGIGKDATKERRAEDPAVGTGTVAATSPGGGDSEYVVSVQIGTPPQNFLLNLDTGSSDLWVFSTQTPASQRNGQPVYNHSASSTSSLVPGASWQITYGDGSNAQGIVYQDTAYCGGVGVRVQNIEAATSVSPSFSSSSLVSGLIGLGQSGGNQIRPGPQKTFMDNVKGSLSKPIFVANLKRNVPGNYDFGFIDSSQLKGTVAYTAVKSDTVYWTVTIDGYQVGTDPYQAQPFTAIADTGTTLLLLSQSTVDRYYAQVKGAHFDPNWGAVVYPCTATLPNFVFGIGSSRYLVPGSYFNYGNVDATNCYGGMQSSSGLGKNIFGDILLKAVLVVFDTANGGRVGFGSKIGVGP